MTLHGPETPRASARGVSSWLIRFYENSGTYLAAWCRLAACAWSAVAGVTLTCLPFFLSWHVAAAGLLALVFTAAYGWLGFFYLANPEWLLKGAPDDDDA